MHQDIPEIKLTNAVYEDIVLMVYKYLKATLKVDDYGTVGQQ